MLFIIVLVEVEKEQIDQQWVFEEVSGVKLA